MADFNDILYSRLPENFKYEKKSSLISFHLSFFFSIEQNDPALNSAEIEKVLIENEREANIKTEKVG
jgi:hypothetical protein